MLIDILLQDFLFIAIDTALLVLFACKSLDRRIHPLLIFAFLCGLQCVRRVVVSEAGPISIIPSLLLDMGGLYFCFLGEIKKKVFLAALFYAFSIIFDIAAIILVSASNNLLTIADETGIYLLSIAMSRIMLFTMISILGKPLRAEHSISEWLRFLPLPALTVLAIIWLHPLTGEMGDTTVAGLLAIICVFGLVANTFTIMIIKRGAEKKRLGYRLRMSEENKQLRKTHIEELRTAYRQIERTAHDIRHHLDYMENAPDIESIRKYIWEIRNRSFSRIFELTGNFDIDTILNAKLRNAAAKGINIEINGTLPSSIDWLDSVDVSIILGNGLENAIEACERIGGGKITSSFKYEDWLIISIENPTGHEPPYRKRGVGFISTKLGIGHGIGIESMESALERYGGHMEHKIINGVYRLDVMLQEPRE